jgi:hypothetical protein
MKTARVGSTTAIHHAANRKNGHRHIGCAQRCGENATS